MPWALLVLSWVLHQMPRRGDRCLSVRRKPPPHPAEAWAVTDTHPPSYRHTCQAWTGVADLGRSGADMPLPSGLVAAASNRRQRSWLSHRLLEAWREDRTWRPRGDMSAGHGAVRGWRISRTMAWPIGRAVIAGRPRSTVRPATRVLGRTPREQHHRSVHRLLWLAGGTIGRVRCVRRVPDSAGACGGFPRAGGRGTLLRQMRTPVLAEPPDGGSQPPQRPGTVRRCSCRSCSGSPSRWASGTGRMRKGQLIAAIEERQRGGEAAAERQGRARWRGHRRSRRSGRARGGQHGPGQQRADNDKPVQRGAPAGAGATRPFEQDAMESETSRSPVVGSGHRAGGRSATAR